jgi:hypothetical protein
MAFDMRVFLYFSNVAFEVTYQAIILCKGWGYWLVQSLVTNVMKRVGHDTWFNCSLFS